jgi:hypothetical protein
MKPNVLNNAVVAVFRCCTDLWVRRFGQTLRVACSTVPRRLATTAVGSVERGRSADAHCSQTYALRVAFRAFHTSRPA